MILRFWPGGVDADEGVEFAEDFAGFVVDLLVDVEEDEGGGVAVGGVFVFVVEAVDVGVEDEAVDLFANFGWEGEEVG